jgi:hypothetical protein
MKLVMAVGLLVGLLLEARNCSNQKTYSLLTSASTVPISFSIGEVSAVEFALKLLRSISAESCYSADGSVHTGFIFIHLHLGNSALDMMKNSIIACRKI